MSTINRRRTSVRILAGENFPYVFKAGRKRPAACGRRTPRLAASLPARRPRPHATMPDMPKPCIHLWNQNAGLRRYVED